MIGLDADDRTCYQHMNDLRGTDRIFGGVRGVGGEDLLLLHSRRMSGLSFARATVLGRKCDERRC